MTKFEPIPRRKLSHDVLDRLLGRINGGEFVAGDFLPSERELMNSFKVGRPAIREAMQTLQRMGLITITHGERARVTAPTAHSVLEQIGGTARHILNTTPGSLAHLKDARIFFELGMARIAAARAKESHVNRLEQRLAEQEAAGDDFSGFLQADIAFHREIAAVAENPIFLAVSDAMLGWLSNYHVGLLRKLGREKQTLSEHRLILDRIGAHDVEGSAAAMLSHLTRVNDLYRGAEIRNGENRAGLRSRKRKGQEN
jgi:GntR family transcriptional regulator, sialic acid-inducible nan operon repressor